MVERDRAVDVGARAAGDPADHVADPVRPREGRPLAGPEREALEAVEQVATGPAAELGARSRSCRSSGAGPLKLGSAAAVDRHLRSGSIRLRSRRKWPALARQSTASTIRWPWQSSWTTGRAAPPGVLATASDARSPTADGQAKVAGRAGPAQRSRRTALSCQRRRIRWESRLKAMKIRTPVSEIRSTAANMRGMLRR